MEFSYPSTVTGLNEVADHHVRQHVDDLEFWNLDQTLGELYRKTEAHPRRGRGRKLRQRGWARAYLLRVTQREFLPSPRRGPEPPAPALLAS